MKNGIENPNKNDSSLSGSFDGEDIRVLKEFTYIRPKIESQLKRIEPILLRESSIKLYNDLSALTSAIIVLLQQANTSKLAIAALFRSLIDCCVSIFVFCKNPKKNASLYHNFSAVLDWNFACIHGNNLGSPPVPDSQEKRDSIQTRKEKIIPVLREFGLSYTRKSLTQDQLLKALAESRFNIFRDTWYTEKRGKIFEEEKMKWVYEVFYKRFSSATHSDSSGSFVLCVENKSHALTWIFQFWCAGIYRLAESLNIKMNAEHKGIVRKCYEWLQGKHQVICDRKKK